ncbi:MAG: hypothetical protein M0P59_12895 [Gallionella sp.]|jgi:hypothetical protein|nr:hypothetical protein [Gallionella sp.]MCK9355033.1 hypothetical protein [Gallionella sp.]
MLFPYKYVPHQMEKMQEFVDFIFHEVWCKAPIGLVFHPDLFSGNPDLKEVITEFGFSAQAAERGKAFYKDVKAIYELFAPLSAQEIDLFKLWYQGNNDIEKVCANDPTVQLARYADIAVSYKDLSEQLANFFKELYSQSLLDLAALRAKIGKIGDHYQTFTSINKTGKCPFCGISDLKGPNRSKREAYDHYLPKALYPFNSINFCNLAPACHECNSVYKLSQDPAHNAAGRRKAFYPYAKVCSGIHVSISLKTADIDRLTPADVQLNFGPTDVHEEIETWREVYGIDERYKDKCCSNDAKDWLEEIRIFQDAHGIAPTAYLATVQQQTQNAPVANSNFLKKAFLEGCQSAGLLDVLAKTGVAP